MSQKSILQSKKKNRTKKAVEKLVTELLTGESDGYVTVPITLKIPKSLYETYKAVAESWNLPLQEALANLAAQGIERGLALSMSMKTSADDIESMGKAVGIDFSQIQEGLNKFTELAKQLENIEEKINENNDGHST